jgi:hypothetical protein
MLGIDGALTHSFNRTGPWTAAFELDPPATNAGHSMPSAEEHERRESGELQRQAGAQDAERIRGHVEHRDAEGQPRTPLGRGVRG